MKKVIKICIFMWEIEQILKYNFNFFTIHISKKKNSKRIKIINELLIVLAKFSWFWLRELPWSTRISTFLLWASTVSKKTSLQNKTLFNNTLTNWGWKYLCRVSWTHGALWLSTLEKDLPLRSALDTKNWLLMVGCDFKFAEKTANTIKNMANDILWDLYHRWGWSLGHGGRAARLRLRWGSWSYERPGRCSLAQACSTGMKPKTAWTSAARTSLRLSPCSGSKRPCTSATSSAAFPSSGI
jgi:hypothetical protein